jgi:SAM-dependent methyltransferase
MVKLDLGCGPNKREGFLGVDQYPFDGKVDVVMNIADPMMWQRWEDGSVEEIHTSHFIEHLTAIERAEVFNQAWRVLVPGGKMTVICPHWGSCRAYGDPTHKWPPIGEMFFYYLDKTWRDANAPHTDRANWGHGYNCNFETTWGYTLNPNLNVRNREYQQFALENYREAAFDIHATMVKKP